MRYYEITISPSSLTSNFEPVTFSSLYNGKDNYAALQLTLDMFQAPFHQPAGKSVVEIFGIDYLTLNRNFNFANISIKVGMTKGLPLVTSRQNEVVKGTILENFGNWQGTHVSMVIVFAPYFFDYGLSDNENLTLLWNKGQTLTDAVTKCLQTTYKNIVVQGSYSPNVKFPETEYLQFSNLESMGEQIYALSKSVIKNSDYLGATIIPTPYGFLLSDGTVPPDQGRIHNDIKYQDVIGNVTWLNYSKLSMKIVMRGDINIGDYVNVPFGVPLLNTVSSYAQTRNKMAFNGNFYVSQVRHVGNFRQADANSWVTILDLVAPTTSVYGIVPA